MSSTLAWCLCDGSNGPWVVSPPGCPLVPTVRARGHACTPPSMDGRGGPYPCQPYGPQLYCFPDRRGAGPRRCCSRCRLCSLLCSLHRSCLHVAPVHDPCWQQRLHGQARAGAAWCSLAVSVRAVCPALAASSAGHEQAGARCPHAWQNWQLSAGCMLIAVIQGAACPRHVPPRAMPLQLSRRHGCIPLAEACPPAAAVVLAVGAWAAQLVVPVHALSICTSLRPEP